MNGTPETPGTLYWTEIGGSIKQIYTDGTGEKTVLSVSGAPLDIALYLPGNQVYWTEDSGTAYQIRRAGIDGSGEESFSSEYDSGSYFGPTAIAIDPAKAIIYWNQYHTHNDIWRSALDNFTAVKWENTITSFYTYSICLDTINKNIYFTANSFWNINTVFGSGKTGVAGFGDIGVANTYSSNPMVDETGPADPSIALRGIAVDGTKGYVYYVSNSNTTDLNIIRSDLTFQNPEVWIASGSFEMQKLALDLVERKIYWTSDTDNSIYRADLDTQNSGIEKFIQLSSKPTGIAIAY